MFFLIPILIMMAATTILGELMRPRPEDNSKPASLKDFSFPTAEETRAIPVFWGTVKMDAPNVVWYGDLKSTKITKRVASGLFSHDNITIAYRYSVGMHFALCHGKVDALLEIQADDKSAWTGSISGATDFTVDAMKLFGGETPDELEKGSEGGLFASCTFYDGDELQGKDAYLNSILSGTEGGTIPAYRGISHLVWKGSRSGVTSGKVISGCIGTSANLKPMSFIMKRIPDYLNPAYKTITTVSGGDDANPADIIYEILINDRWFSRRFD